MIGAERTSNIWIIFAVATSCTMPGAKANMDQKSSASPRPIYPVQDHRRCLSLDVMAEQNFTI